MHCKIENKIQYFNLAHFFKNKYVHNTQYAHILHRVMQSLSSFYDSAGNGKSRFLKVKTIKQPSNFDKQG